MAEAAQTIEDRISAAIAPEEVPQEAPQEAPQEVDQEVDQEVEQTEERPEDVTEAASAEEPEETAEEVESTEEEESSIEDIGQLAEHLGIEVSELYNLRVPITDADGKRKEVSLGEWKDGYQLNEQAQKVQKQAQEEYDTLLQRRAEFEQQVEQQAHQASRYVQAAQQELTQEFNAINWDRLRAESPEQYAVKRQDFIERNGRLTQLQQEVANEYQQQRQELDEQRNAQLGQYLQREQEKLYEAVPEWRNEEAAGAEKSRVSEYLQSAGYTTEEIGKAYDHRAIVLARKAMLWDESQKKSVKAKKALKIGKRVLKPGPATSKQDQHAERERQLRKQLHGNRGSVDAAAELIAHRLGRTGG